MDLNCDMGESYGLWKMGDDEAMMPYITSANIACGFHAGDPHIMRKTVEMAVQYKVAIGAHPGYCDLIGFGRRNLSATREEIIELMAYQLGALDGMCRLSGTRIVHVKPHGALYNTAAVDPAVADAVAVGIKAYNPDLILVGLAGSLLVDAAKEHGLSVAGEAFADRQYQDDGTLVPRSHPGAVLHDADDVAIRVMDMIRTRTIRSISGKSIELDFDTVCLHGDTPGAVQMAAEIRAMLDSKHISLTSLAGRN